jgi:hypothetical protein
MLYLISLLEIALGLTCIILAKIYRFGEKFYTVRQAYMSYLNTHFKSYGRFLGHIDKTSRERYPSLQSLDRRLGIFIQWIYYLVGLGTIILGVRNIIVREYSYLDIVVILLIPFIVLLYLTAGKPRDRIDEDEHTD